MLCFPECASTGFDWIFKPRVRQRPQAEPVPGPIVRLFAEKANATDMYIIFGMVERPRGSTKLYNTAFLVGPNEGYIGRYRKVFCEGRFAPGTEAEVFPTRYGPISIIICADMRSPELVRLLAFKGARIIFQPTNYFHRGMTEQLARRRYQGKIASQRSRAMENGICLVTANGGRRDYVNNTRIVGPDMQGPEPVLAHATRKEQVVSAEIEIHSTVNSAVTAARECPWLFSQLGRIMIRAAGTAD